MKDLLTNDESTLIDSTKFDLSELTIGLSWKLPQQEPMSKIKRWFSEDIKPVDLDAIAFLLDENDRVANLGRIEYLNESLEAIYHDEGRVVPVENDEDLTPDSGNNLNLSFRYEYTLSDHLGNGRVFFSDVNGDGLVQVDPDAGEVLQEGHYYPFGLGMDGPWVAQSGVKNQYLYNGKN